MGLWACEPMNLTETPTYPKIPDPPIAAAGLLGPDLVGTNVIKVSNTQCTLFDACHPTALPQFVTPHASRPLNL